MMIRIVQETVTMVCGNDMPTKDFDLKNRVQEDLGGDVIWGVDVCDIKRTEIEATYYKDWEDGAKIRIQQRCVDCGIIWAIDTIIEKNVENIIVILEENAS